MDTAKLASVVTAIGFAIGMLFNYGYFLGLGLNFFTFLTYKDHLTVLIYFAAPCLLVALLFTAYRNRIIDTIMAVWIVSIIAIWSGQTQLTGMPKLTRFISWFITVSSFFFISYLASVLLGQLTSSIEVEKKVAKAVPVGLLLIVVLILYGRYSYRTDIASSQYETEVTLASEDKTEPHSQPAHIVRAVDDGIFMILQSTPDHVVFVKKDTVKMLAKKVDR